IAVRIFEMEAPAAGKSEYRPDDLRTRGFEALLGLGQIIGIENDQRPAGLDRTVSRQPTGQAAVGEFAIGRPVVSEGAAECLAVEGARPRDVADVEFDIVDLTILASHAHGQLPDG